MKRISLAVLLGTVALIAPAAHASSASSAACSAVTTVTATVTATVTTVVTLPDTFTVDCTV